LSENIEIIDYMVKNGQMRVGSGFKKDNLCGAFFGHVGCLNTHLHGIVTLDDGVNHDGKGYFKRVYHSCDRPECPICYRRWAVRQAGDAEEILKKASCGYTDEKDKKHSGLGLIEHVIDSPSKCEYELPFEKLKANSLKAVRKRGFLGGFQIYHAQRFANPFEAKQKGIPQGWRYSPHFHYLGFLDGGFGSCRSCHKNKLQCWSCGGFEGVTRRLNVTDGHIVKVKGARKTIFGSLFYQLNHATLIRGKSRSHVGSWVGVCSYTKLKLKKGDRKKKGVCPICGYDLVPVKYVGEGEPNGGQWWWEEFEEDYLDERGVPKWIELEIDRGKFSYE
jgi:hypothetical protein